jgi:hypothetical protein
MKQTETWITQRSLAKVVELSTSFAEAVAEVAAASRRTMLGNDGVSSATTGVSYAAYSLHDSPSEPSFVTKTLVPGLLDSLNLVLQSQHQQKNVPSTSDTVAQSDSEVITERNVWTLLGALAGTELLKDVTPMSVKSISTDASGYHANSDSPPDLVLNLALQV